MKNMLAKLRHSQRTQGNAFPPTLDLQQGHLTPDSTQFQAYLANFPVLIDCSDMSESTEMRRSAVIRRVAWLSTSIVFSGFAAIPLANAAFAQAQPTPSGYGVEGRSDSTAALQRQLSSLGYYNGEITGYYGPQTRQAVMQFQRDMGLTPDGVVGPATSQALSQYGAPPRTQGQSPSGSTLPMIRLNDGGDQVAELQRRLADLGYNISVSGTFDYPTEAAVMQFQRDNGLTPDGVVGPSTEEFLRRPTSDLARPGSSAPSGLNQSNQPNSQSNSSNPSAPANETIASNGALRLGDNGEPVSNLQLRLKELGYYQGGISGVYGPETEAAVLAFQQSQGLAVDGIAGPQVNSALFSYIAPTTSSPNSVGGTSSSVPTPQTDATGAAIEGSAAVNTPNPATDPLNSSPANSSPVNTPQVNTPQVTVPQLDAPETTPELQTQTLQQLEQAQLEAERAQLEAEQARRVLFQNVDEGRYSVAALQRQLRNRGYYPGNVTGVFSVDTQSAVVEAQQTYGLTQADWIGDSGVTYQLPY
jgi:peptidoglycan hydrolase-like protein with peptidoglycan-binding domain